MLADGAPCGWRANHDEGEVRVLHARIGDPVTRWRGRGRLLLRDSATRISDRLRLCGAQRLCHPVVLENREKRALVAVTVWFRDRRDLRRRLGAGAAGHALCLAIGRQVFCSRRLGGRKGRRKTGRKKTNALSLALKERQVTCSLTPTARPSSAFGMTDPRTTPWLGGDLLTDEPDRHDRVGPIAEHVVCDAGVDYTWLAPGHILGRGSCNSDLKRTMYDAKARREFQERREERQSKTRRKKRRREGNELYGLSGGRKEAGLRRGWGRRNGGA